MATTALSFSLSLDSRQPLFLKSHPNSSLNTNTTTTTNKKPLSLSYTHPSSYPAQPLLLYKFHRLYSALPSPSSSSSSSTSSDSYLNNPLPKERFLDAEGASELNKFVYNSKVHGGSLEVREMREEEIDITVKLLAASFAESMSVPSRFANLLGFLVKQYMRERRALRPHAVTLVGFFEGEDGKGELAGTVEVSFDDKGANVSLPTPTPPMNSPYICNMAVSKKLRRRGIGWNLLRATEKLISVMTTRREVYLHCRMIDSVPLNMYKKAGYSVIKTDSILILFTFQRRKHLMCKRLPGLNNPQWDIEGHIDQPTP